jgi:hypothetical protein
VKDVGCWDHEREVAEYVAATHRAAIATHTRIALHPEVITINHAEAVEEAVAPLAYEKNVANAKLLVEHADRHHAIARANAWCHRLTVHNGEPHATYHAKETKRNDKQQFPHHYSVTLRASKTSVMPAEEFAPPVALAGRLIVNVYTARVALIPLSDPALRDRQSDPTGAANEAADVSPAKLPE